MRVLRPGQILAADVVRMMAGRRHPLPVRSLGDLDLKGLREPVPTVEVLWEPLVPAEFSVPLPRRLTVRPASVVGRRSELTLLAGAASVSSTVRAGRWCWCRASPARARPPWSPRRPGSPMPTGPACCSVAARRTWPTPTSCSPRPSARTSSRPTSAGSAGWSSPSVRSGCGSSRRSVNEFPISLRPEATNSDSERYLLFAGAVGLLRELARDTPIVLVLDDLQWADSGSLALLRHLVAAEPAMRVLVIGTFRDRELPQAPVLRETLGMLRRHPGSPVWSSVGWTARGSRSCWKWPPAIPSMRSAWVSPRWSTERPTATRSSSPKCSAISRDTGAIHQNRAGRWVATGTLDRSALPESVREVIGGRIVRLGPEAERVLSTAAVIGRDFDLDVLERSDRGPSGLPARHPGCRRRPPPWSRGSMTLPVATASATRWCNTRCTRSWARPAELGCTSGWPGPWSISVPARPVPGWESSPTTGSMPLPGQPAPRHPLLTPGGHRRPRLTGTG